MIDSGDLYKAVFSDAGWGKLVPTHGGPGVLWSTLGFKRQPCVLTDSGKIFVRNTSTNTSYWVDTTEHLSEKSVRAIHISDKKVVVIVFTK